MFALAHMGKATSDGQFDPDAPSSTYTNPSAHTRISSYVEAVRIVHGPDFDPRTEERLDPELMMRVGQGKKHGRFLIDDNLLGMASTPPLSQLDTLAKRMLLLCRQGGCCSCAHIVYYISVVLLGAVWYSLLNKFMSCFLALSAKRVRAKALHV